MLSFNQTTTRIFQLTIFGAALAMIQFDGSIYADVTNDEVDIEINDLSAGVDGVGGADNADVSNSDLELEHTGAGGFDVDINVLPNGDLHVTIAHFAPIDGFGVGAFEWNIFDVQWRDADGHRVTGYITGIQDFPGATNAMPTLGLAYTRASISIATNPFASNSTGAYSDYLVTVARPLLGDVNQDGSVTLLDVTPFVGKVLSGEFQGEADTNIDGLVDLLDVTSFVQIVTGG